MSSTVATPETNSFGFSKYEKIVIALLALTQFSVVLDFMVMSPLGDILIKSMNLSTQQFGLVISSYAFSAGVSGFLTAGFADKFDRKKLLVFFYAGFILGTLFCAFSDSYHTLLVARIVTGIFGGVIGSISMAIVTDLFALNKRGRVMGFIQMGFGSSQVLGIPISLYLATQWNWEMPFFMIVGLALLILIAVIWIMRPVTAHLNLEKTHNPLMHLLETIKNPTYLLGFLTTSLLSIGGFMMMPWGSSFAINNLGVTHTQLPLLFMISGLATLVAMPLIGRVSDRFDRFKLFVFASVWMIIIVVIYTRLEVLPFEVVAVCNVVLMVGIMVRVIPAMALVTELPAMTDRGAFMSINTSLQQVSGGVAAVISGWIVTQPTKTSPLLHYDLVGYCTIVVGIISIFSLRKVSEKIRQRNTEKSL